MKNLKEFALFVKESKGFSGLPGVNIPENVILFLQEIVGKNHLSKFLGDKNLKEIYLDDSNDEDLGSKIAVNWKDFFFHIPFVEYNPDTNSIYLTGAYNMEAQETIDQLKEKFGISSPTWNLDFDLEIADSRKKTTIYDIISDLISGSRKEMDFLNIFETDFKNTPEFKFLEKLGTKVASSSLQTKRGVLVLEIPNYLGGIAIYPNGYLRKLGERSQVLTNNPELNVPIYTMETLRKKLSYILEIVLKSHFKKFNIPSNEIATIIKQIGGDESAEYSEMARELVKKYPELVIVLPEPEGGFDADLKAGAKLLNRFGAFGS